MRDGVIAQGAMPSPHGGNVVYHWTLDYTGRAKWVSIWQQELGKDEQYKVVSMPLDTFQRMSKAIAWHAGDREGGGDA